MKSNNLLRVLLVDSDPAFLEVLKHLLLINKHFVVETVSSAFEALRKLAAAPFDVVVSAYDMPGKNGLELLEELRGSGDNVPFIVFTGKSREEIAVKALNLGANYYLNKHGKPDVVYGELLHAIKCTVRAARAERALRESEEKFRVYVETSPVAIFVSDLRGRFEYANAAASKLLGYSVKELQKMGIPQIAFAEDMRGVVHDFSRGDVLRVHQRIRMRHKKGVAVFVDINVASLPDGKLIAFCEDVTEQTKAVEALRQSQERFFKIFHSSPSPMFLSRVSDGRFTDVNESFLRLIGYSREELIGHTSLEVGLFSDPDERAQLVDMMRKQGSVRNFEVKARAKDGRNLRLLVSTILAKFDGQDYAITTHTDVTELKNSEEKLRVLNRSLRTLSKVNQALIHATDYVAFAQEVCRIVVDCCGYTLAWIGFAEHDKNKTVKVVACEGIAKDYVESLKLTWADALRGRGPTGRAIRTGKVQFCKNIYTDPSVKPWHKQAAEKGYVSSIALPLASEGEVLGVLNIYSTVPFPFSDEEVTLLTEIAGDVGYGLKMLRLRAEHEQAEKELVKAKEEWEKTFHTMRDPIAIIDSNYRILRVNQAMAQKLGLTPEQCVGLTCYEHVHGTDAPPEFCPCAQTLKDRQEHVAELQLPKLGGYFIIRTSPLKDEKGQLVGAVHIATDITEVKKAEAALRTSERQLRFVVDNLPGAVWTIDASMRFTGSYGLMLSDVGLEAKEAVGMELSEFLRNQSNKKTILGLHKRALAGEKFTFETKFDDRMYMASIAPITGENDDVVGVFGFAIDVTEQAKIIEALRVSEEKFSKVFQYSPSGIVLTRVKDGVIIEVNQSAMEILGYTREELLGHSTLEFDFWGSPAEREQFMRELSAKGFVRDYEFAMRRKDGTAGVVDVSAETMEVEGERCMLSTFNDVTERCQAVESLMASERQYRSLVENSFDGVMLTKPDGTILAANPQACHMLGMTEEEIKKAGREGIMVKDEKLAAALRERKEKGHAVAELTFRRKDGTAFTADVSSSVFVDAEGVTKTSMIIRDITERKQAEAQLRASEKRFRETLDNMIEGCQIIGYDWRYVYVNDAAAEHGRTKKEKLLGKTMMEAYPGIKKTAMFAELQRCMRNRCSTRIENEFTFPDGAKGWFELRVHPVSEGLFILSINITELKMIAKMLSKHVDQQAAVAELGQLALTQIDLDKFLNKVVRKVATVLGVKYCKVLELLPSRKAFLLRAGVGWKKGLVGKAKVKAEKQSQAGYTLFSTEPVIAEDIQMEKRFSAPPLLRQHKVVSGVSVIIGSVENPFGVLGVHTAKKRYFSKDDVNFVQAAANLLAQFIENRQDERQLRESEQRWATTLASIGDAVIATDTKGKVTFMNNVAEHLTGWRLAEASQKPLKRVFKIINEKTREPVVNPVAEVIQNERIVSLAKQAILLSKSGKAIPIDESGAPIEDEKGNITGVVLIFRDVTARRKALRHIESIAKFPLENTEPVLRISSDGKILFANPASRRLLAGSPLKPGDKALASWRNHVADALATHKHATFEEEHNGRVFRFMVTPLASAGYANLYVTDITARKKAENDIRQSEARYRSLYETVSGGVVVQDQNGKIVAANEVACGILGLTVDQIRGRTSMDPRWRTIHEDGSPFPGTEHPAMITLHTGKPVRNGVMGVYNPNTDAHRWIQINSEAIIDRFSGKINGVMTTFLDVTEHKRLKDELAENEKKYRSLFSSMNEGVCLHEIVYDEAGKAVDYIILEANPVYETLTGIKREKAIGKRASELYGTGEPPYFDIYTKVAESGEPTTFETYFPPLEKHFRISVFSPTKGKFATVFSDTTEHREQEALLKASEQKFELLFAKNPAAIVLVDEKMRIKEVNPAFTQLFGFPLEEVQNASLPDLVVPDDLKNESKKLAKKAKSGMVETETVRKRKDGLELNVTLSIEPIFEQEKFAGFIVVYKDVSELVQAKETLETALYETEVLNEKLNVVGGLTRHNVRNKLMAIAGQAYLLQKKIGDNADVKACTAKLETLVKQAERLLDFSRVYEKMGMEQLRPMNVSDCFNSAAAMFPELKKLRVSNELGELIVTADSLLMQVFYNLIDNSLKHGAKVTEIRAYSTKKDGKLQLVYEDNGVGIAETAKPKLFTADPDATKAMAHGLFLIQKLMAVYGWTITENGEPGKGAKFTMTIPEKTNQQP